MYAIILKEINKSYVLFMLFFCCSNKIDAWLRKFMVNQKRFKVLEEGPCTFHKMFFYIGHLSIFKDFCLSARHNKTVCRQDSIKPPTFVLRFE